MADSVAVRDLTVVVSDGGATRAIVDGLSLSAGERSILGVAGPSGSGKTTILMCLAGVAEFQGGSITIGDTERQPGELASSAQLRDLGIVFQDYHLIKTLNVLDNVALPLRIDGHSWNQSRRTATETLKDLVIDHLAGQYPSSLSGGEQQRTALARAAVRKPHVVLADEPTAHLDAEATDLLARNLRQLADSGSCVIVSSHDARLLSLCDATVQLG